MAFIRCEDCDWSQDDFWSEEYSPTSDIELALKTIDDFINDPEQNRTLAVENEIVEALDIPILAPLEDGMSEVDFRAYTVALLLRGAKRIGEMVWPTFEDFKNDHEKTCPECESENLIMD